MNRKRKKIRRLAAITLSLALLFPVLTACGKGGEADGGEERVLRIASAYGMGPDDDYFRSQYIDLFEFDNPNIKIEIIPTYDNRFRYGGGSPEDKPVDPADKLKELMTGPNPPDVVVLGYEQLPDFINENLLAPLDPLITKDKFDTSDFVPAVIDGLKDAGGGKLYALAPTFTSSALIYNKKLFDEAGVAYPKDNMTWDEVFALARQVSRGEGENRKYGFAFSTYKGADPFWDMNVYTAPLQLTMFDDAGEKMTVDTPQWEKVWQTIAQLKKDKVYPEPPDYNKPKKENEFQPFEHDNFMSGNLAMAIVQFYQLNELITANRDAQNIKGYTPIDWDIVTVPTHPEAPGVGGYVGMSPILAINAKAQNPDIAWKYVSFINGEQFAKLKSRSSQNLVSRKKYLEAREDVDYNIKALYSLKPVMSPDMNKVYREKPDIWQVQDIGRNKFQEVIDGKKTIKEALKEWQTEGDAALKRMKENPRGEPKGGAIPLG